MRRMIFAELKQRESFAVSFNNKKIYFASEGTLWISYKIYSPGSRCRAFMCIYRFAGKNACTAILIRTPVLGQR